MKSMLSTIVAALVATSFAATASVAGVPEPSAAPVAQLRMDQVMLVKTAEKRYRGRVTYQTAGDKETAPLNPPAVPRVYMVTPARPAVK